jgi:DNA replication and repair protein RecF
VQIRSLRLLDFRNYQALSYSPSERLNVLTGRNAQGKSNLLESIGFLVAGRSFRTPRLAEMPRWGATSSLVEGELRRGDGGRKVRRTIQQLEDGTWEVAGDSCDWARAIPFGWHDLSILTGAPATRRAFLDGFTGRLHPGHLAALVRYRQILERRSVLLKRGDVDRLAPWDEALAGVGLELLKRRRAATGALQTELARIYPLLAGEWKKVEIRYRSTLGEATEPAEFVSALERLRAEELRRKQTLVGPHRDDLLIELDGIDARVFASRGQQRLLALALRLAEVLPVTEATGTPPVLLLDDALSELDPSVQASVLREVRTLAQVFLTTAGGPLPIDDATTIEVQGGGLVAV